jgi:Tfp pilus assembly protein PilO
VSRKLRMILMGFGLVVFAVVVWFFVLSPIRGNIAETEASIETQRGKLSDANRELEQASTTKAEGKRNQARLLELAKMIPASEELPSLLLQIQDLADQSGIDFLSITPGDISEVEGMEFEIVPLDLIFTGTFFDLSDFVYRAEMMVGGPGRLLAIKSISLTIANANQAGASTVSPDLEVNLSLLAFILPPGGTGGSVPAAAAPATGGASTTNTTAAPSQ